MNAREFGVLFERLAQVWEGADWGEDTAGGYERVLEDLPGEAVLVALASYEAEGHPFRPNAGQLWKRTIELLLDVPDFDEAYPLIQRLVKSGYGGPLDGIDFRGRPTRAREVCEQIMERMHPKVREFVVGLGKPQLLEDASNEDHGSVRLRRKYEDFLKRVHRDVALAGIEGADDLPAVQRARREGPRHLRTALGDAVKELGPGA